MTVDALITKLAQLPNDWYVSMHTGDKRLTFGAAHAPVYVELTGTLTGEPQFTVYTSHDEQPVPNQWLRDKEDTP